ncbi:MAG: UDP-3-O-(3-hydroxymyristoyl)glucosamine N-acyltransferase [Pseudomonadota bacterium]
MGHSISDIAKATGLRAEGDLSLRIERPAEPAEAGSGDLALAMAPKYATELQGSDVEAAILWDDADWQALGLKAALFAPRARVALAAIGEVFAYPLDLEPGIHPTALIHETAVLGEDCWVGPYCVIGAGVQVGPGARIMSHCTIGAGAELGDDAILYAGVRIGARVKAGHRLIVQMNSVIGGEGFSYVTPDRGSVESAKETGAVSADARNLSLRRIASLGTVVLGDDVEIGAGATIDRGTVANTRVGNGTKIDNQVMLGHNVVVGETCMLCAQVGLAGSVRVGDRVVLGGQVGCADHIEIGSDVVVAGGSLIGTRIVSGSVMMGVPAMPRERFLEQVKFLRRLPRLHRQIDGITKKLGL